VIHTTLIRRLSTLFVLLIAFGIRGNDLYVSPNGTPQGPGTMTEPYDLVTALSGGVGQAGATFWLSGGDYVIGHIDTKIAGTPGQPLTFRQMPGERARVDGSLTIWDSIGYVVLRDFELHNSDTNRLSAQTGVGFDPTDIRLYPGISSYAPNLSFINLIVHDQTRHGFYISQVSSNNLIYGCVVYNNGWASPDNAEGHGIYAQGAEGTKEISDTLVFNNSGVNMHIYDNTTNGKLAGLTMDGNVAFNAGALQQVRAYRDWIVGVDAPAISADRIVLKNNMGYYPPTSGASEEVEIGREGINGSVALLNNYLPQGLLMNNWTIAAVAGNLFASQTANHILSLNQARLPLAAAWNGNSYSGSGPIGDFVRDSAKHGFQDWQSATGYDKNSTYVPENLSGMKVFVRSNRYEAGRANIIVYDWDNQSSVPVDVSSVLTPGAAYEVRNAQDFFAPPVLSGIFDGNPLYLPMTGLTVAAPNGPLLTPPPTGPTFNVFVLLPRSVRLQASAVGRQAEFSWPMNSGNWVLQSTTSLSTDSAWTDVTDAPAILGDRYVVTQTAFENFRFYRLRAAP
jgi:hypothetical protein